MKVVGSAPMTGSRPSAWLLGLVSSLPSPSLRVAMLRRRVRRGSRGPVDTRPRWCCDHVRLPTGNKWGSSKPSAPGSATRNRCSDRIWICRSSNQGTQFSSVSGPDWSLLELVTVCSDRFWWGGDVRRFQCLPGGISGGRSTRPDNRRSDCRQRAWCRPLPRESGSFTGGTCRRIIRVDCHCRKRDLLEPESSRSGRCPSHPPLSATPQID